jgi:hypothetical protein
MTPRTTRGRWSAEPSLFSSQQKARAARRPKRRYLSIDGDFEMMETNGGKILIEKIDR